MKPARKICFVLKRVVNKKGGAERVVADLANGLSDRGYEVSIATFERARGTMAYPLNDDVLMENLFYWVSPISHGFRSLLERIAKRWSWLYWHLKFDAFSRVVNAYVRKNAVDVVIAVMPPAITAVGNATLPSSVLRIASNRNDPMQDYANPERWEGGTYGMQRRLALLENFDVNHVLLPEFITWFPDTIREKTTVIPNIVYPTPLENRAHVRSEKKVVAIGRLSSTKRIDILLKAWACIHTDFPDWELEVYGDGPMKDMLIDILEKADLPLTILKGHVENVLTVYSQAAFIAHPSAFEGFSNAIGEAMSRGLPVLGFADCSGLNSLVKDDENGVLVSGAPDRVANFTAGLRQLMSDDDLRFRLGQCALEKSKQYEPGGIFDAWEKIITE